LAHGFGPIVKEVDVSEKRRRRQNRDNN
jgi:hypothetical protein